ncbi:MAG: hypothetical protein AB7S26_29115 [Sandaracinaceae bacterium]
MSVLMCSKDHLSVVAIVAMASNLGEGVEGLRRGLREMRSRAMEHEAAVASGDAMAAWRLSLERAELSALRPLWLANRRALAERYGKAPEEDEPTITAADFDRLDAHLTDPVTVLKLTSRYEYQACEAPDWATSTARDHCDAAKAIAGYCLPGWSSRPAYL